MIFRSCLLCLLFSLCETLLVSNIRDYLSIGSGEVLYAQKSTEWFSSLMANSSSGTNTYTSGFLRTDIFNSFDDKWVRAQVWAIGTCFKEGNRGGSAKFVQVTINSSHAMGLACIYNASDCSGSYFQVPFTILVDKLFDQFVSTVSHVPDMDMALEIDSGFTDGLIVTSYYSSEGCRGGAAQYDLFSTNDGNVYDDFIDAYGVFQCDSRAEMMVLTLCDNALVGNEHKGSPFEVLSEPASEVGYDINGVNADIYKQPFRCTEAGAIGDPFPTYQTVRCVKDDQEEPPDHVGYDYGDRDFAAEADSAYYAVYSDKN